MQYAHDDDETLEPNSGVHAHTNEIDDENISTAPAEPEELRRKDIAKQHAHPPVPPVGTEDAVPKREPLVSVAAVPSHEKFPRAGEGDERTGQQNDLCHFVDVLRRDDVVKFEKGARGDKQR